MLMKSMIAAGLLIFASTVHAATLTIDLGNSDGRNVCTIGSCFGLDTQIPLNGVPDTFVNISGLQGLVVDGLTIQPASGSHLGAPDGSESPGIDHPWEFAGGTGMHYTNAPLTKAGGTGNTLSLDLTGLHVLWGGRALGRYEAALGVYENAVVTCQSNCGDGESYILTYRMLLSAECGPEGDQSCFGRVYQYDYLTLRGKIIGNDLANVPVPAAIWLFASGLLSLMGIAKRKFINVC
jgi:hypothetical protein